MKSNSRDVIFLIMNKDEIAAIKYQVVGMNVDVAKSLILSFGLPYLIVTDEMIISDLNDFCVCLYVENGNVKDSVFAYEKK